MEQSSCLFCKIAKQEIKSPFILESDHCYVIKDINPQAPIHYLIIPKSHIVDIGQAKPDDEVILGDLLMCAQKLSTIDDNHAQFRLKINNGFNAGQRVFHVHCHFLAGKTYAE